ncbi:MAG: hypothetical protein JWP22_946 [Ramlibacter sp.]|nr:hypothetical protein [Ramlibacter sp.]MDB5912271.1 hypothetical protein [Ramlibacter sp.]
MLKIFECLVGTLLAVLTLRDVFDTVIVPGGSRGQLKVVRRIVLLALPLSRRIGAPGIGLGFAPMVLVTAFFVWMLLLVLGFGLMIDAFRSSFSPPLAGFAHALFAAGSALTTIGTGPADVRGAAAAVLIAAGFCGLAVMTMAVTYMLEVQSNVAHRDTGVLKAGLLSGQPPSALRLLERYAAIGCRDELIPALRHGRDWCASVLQSHATHPSLIYFRSAGVGSGWPATLGTLMDLCLLIEYLVDEPQARGLATLLREEADQLARELTLLLDLEPAAISDSPAQVHALCDRLRAAGYGVRGAMDLPGFIAARAAHVGRIEALANHIGLPAAPLLG